MDKRDVTLAGYELGQPKVESNYTGANTSCGMHCPNLLIFKYHFIRQMTTHVLLGNRHFRIHFTGVCV